MKPAIALRFHRRSVGEPAPWFRQRTAANARFAFDVMAGRYVVLCFFGSASDPAAKAALAAIDAHAHLFDDAKISLFGVSIDPADEAEGRVRDRVSGIRFFWDFDRSVSEAYGVTPLDSGAGAPRQMRRAWFVLDPMLRIIAHFPLGEQGGQDRALWDFLRGLPPVDRATAGVEAFAPVLNLPNVFEPEFCAQLIAYYGARGGERSGFMRDVEGKTQLLHDPNHKRRKDVLIQDQALVRETQVRVLRRICPMIARAHQFQATRMERYLIACYEDQEKGFFRPHRDNTTKGTAHRRFAISVNLNADFDGGELRFPEFGSRTYKPAPGAAVVFSCGLLHEVTPVVRGRRYAFLPFLYDEQAAQEREKNNEFLGEGVGAYVATPKLD